MARVRHLRNAPITEAIVDFRVSPARDFEPDRLREARDRLREDYPKVVERKGLEAFVEVSPAGLKQPPKTRDLGFQGLWLRPADELQVAQFRIDGFTFNRLKPYSGWEQILPEALRLWRVYVDLARPEGITRLALRYINHMGLPSPPVELDDYLVTGPSLAPSSTPQALSGFATRVVVQYPERRMQATVIQALEVGLETSAHSLRFDIDVSRAAALEIDETVLRETLGELRACKNEIFFGSLTERFVGAFE